MSVKSNTYVSVFPRINDTVTRLHAPDIGYGDKPTTITAIVIGDDVTIQFDTRQAALDWVAHVHQLVTTAVIAANEADGVLEVAS